MNHSHDELTRLRIEVSRRLRVDEPDKAAVQRCLVQRRSADMLLPSDVRNYSDFFTSIHHASNAAAINNPGGSLSANFQHIPLAYHGRCSTLSVSGTNFHRPLGQSRLPQQPAPHFGPSQALDFECELGIYVGQGTAFGDRIRLGEADNHIFGFSILNDWSARDIQAWESVPVGPFLGKNFITSLSPWVITLDAMTPFRHAATDRTKDAPELLPYLYDEADRTHGGLDIQFEISIRSLLMRKQNLPAYIFSRPKFKDHYWTVFQMLTHQTVNGCTVIPGDVLGSGTVSGPTQDELGCIKEFTLGGRRPFELPSGESRTYLEDGDELILGASCSREGFASIGFGQCVGTILPARNPL
jgi:fumarylacetoacetase